MSAAPGWEGSPDPDEPIVWQGSPGRELRCEGRVATVAMGVFVTGLSTFWIGMTAWMTHDDGFPAALMPLFGLIFLNHGAGMAGGFALRDRYTRRRTFSTLADRRTFIARRLFGHKTLESWAIADLDRLEFERGPPANPWFVTRKGRKGRVEKTGFRHLDAAGDVHRLIRGLRKETA